MTPEKFFQFVHYCVSYKKHRTILVEGKRGKGKSWTMWSLVQMARKYALTACYAQNAEEVRIANILVVDDPTNFYKRDYMKSGNKDRAKALQKARGVIEILFLTVPSIERLDIDIREEYSIHAEVITHGWLDIDGVIVGPFVPQSKMPNDIEQRIKEFKKGWTASA